MISACSQDVGEEDGMVAAFRSKCEEKARRGSVDKSASGPVRTTNKYETE